MTLTGKEGIVKIAIIVNLIPIEKVYTAELFAHP